MPIEGTAASPGELNDCFKMCREKDRGMEPTGPLRAFRDCYVGLFRGFSYDLAAGAIGVHPDFVQLAPELPGRRVVATHEGHRAPPRVQLACQVVVMDRLMRDARAVGEEGGLVFSTFDLDDPHGRRFLDKLSLGDPVYLNAALSRLPEPVVKRPDAFAA